MDSYSTVLKDFAKANGNGNGLLGFETCNGEVMPIYQNKGIVAQIKANGIDELKTAEKFKIHQ